MRDRVGPVAFGTAGSHRLRDGVVHGVDPLLPYGPYARRDLLRHQESAHVGDLVLISAVDPVTDEVAAFEELVGSHGGLGGWQTDAVLVHPARWPVTVRSWTARTPYTGSWLSGSSCWGCVGSPAGRDAPAAIEPGRPIGAAGVSTSSLRTPLSAGPGAGSPPSTGSG